MHVANILFGAYSSPLSNLLQARSRVDETRNALAAPTVAMVKNQISQATRLDKASKTTLNNLTNTVDKYASGNTKLLRDVAGIANLLQFSGKEQGYNTDSTQPYTAILNSYYTGYFSKRGVNVNFDA